MTSRLSLLSVAAASVVAACLLASSPALAAWKIEVGEKASKASMTGHPTAPGRMATVAAKAPVKGVTARLQLECYYDPAVAGLMFGIVLSNGPKLFGGMSERYHYDDKEPVETRRTSRVPGHPGVQLLGEPISGIVKGLYGAKRMRISLLPYPPGSPEIGPFEFVVTGAEDAIQQLLCVEISPRWSR